MNPSFPRFDSPQHLLAGYAGEGLAWYFLVNCSTQPESDALSLIFFADLTFGFAFDTDLTLGLAFDTDLTLGFTFLTDLTLGFFVLDLFRLTDFF
jgi:hypothetical protein